MLGAIITTFCWFLKEGGLLQRGRQAAPIVEPGMICIRVRCRLDQAITAQKSLEAAGASNIRTVETLDDGAVWCSSTDDGGNRGSG